MSFDTENPVPDPERSQEDLHWLAFRYVSGELSPPAEESFERLLENDQSAREAVERAVELQAAIRAVSTVSPATRTAASPSSLVSSSQSMRRVVAWTSVITVCLIVSAAVWVAMNSGPPEMVQRPVDRPDPVTPPHPQIGLELDFALAWAEVHRQDDPAALPFGAVVWPPEAVEPGVDAAEPVVTEELEDGVPGWLMTAIASEEEPGEEDR